MNATGPGRGVTGPDEPLLVVRDLCVAFPTRRGIVLAVNGVGFSLEAGRTLGLVGESGCGKSMTLRAILGLVPHPGEVIGGSIRLRGRELLGLDGSRMRDVRGLEVSMIFQDPGASLDPVFSVGDQLAETLRLRLGLDRARAERRSIELLDRVGIPSASARLRDYPHQLSGGMRQRVMIALAIATDPILLLADEPTTALDVTIQDQILELLTEIREETGMGMILVSHDAGVIAQTADQVAVMYAGHLLETGPAEVVLAAPRHPYTRGLVSAIPSLAARDRGARLVPIPGQPPDLAALPQGCPFAPRCGHATDACTWVPVTLDAASPGHGSACPFVGSESGEGGPARSIGVASSPGGGP
jgi:oligopeptide/dipeptide ABC transporter ATP-binding protein